MSRAMSASVSPPNPGIVGPNNQITSEARIAPRGAVDNRWALNCSSRIACVGLSRELTNWHVRRLACTISFMR